MNKYQHILNNYSRDHWDMLTKIFDESIAYIKANYENESLETKIAAVNVVKNIYLQTNDFSIDQLHNYIDKFFIYSKNEYDIYRSQFEIVSDEFHLNLCFYNSFVEKKQYLVDTR